MYEIFILSGKKKKRKKEGMPLTSKCRKVLQMCYAEKYFGRVNDCELNYK